MLGQYLANVVQIVIRGLMTYCYFLFLPIFIGILIAWLMELINLSILIPAMMLKSAALLLAMFISGALIGKKIAGEPGGLFPFFIAILAFSSFAFLLFSEAQGMELISQYVPLMEKSIPEILYLSLPAVGLFGVVMYRTITVGND